VIRIDCDNCEETFEVGDEQAGGKASCPKCGDVNRVPNAAAAKAGDLPPEHGPEQPIQDVHPAMVRAHPFRAATILLMLLLGGWLVVRGALEEQTSRFWIWLGLFLLAAAVVWWIVWYLGAHLWVKLEISNKRTIRREGIIRRHTSEVLHDHVRNVEIRQSFLQRILNVGYLGISSSGQDGIEIEVHDIPRPYDLKAVIDRYRDM